ncbi:MAG: tyrosine-protein phosphatase [Phycisphaerales bacterium JB063]
MNHDPENTPHPFAPPPPGRIDIHSHVLPGIDDGCTTLTESIQAVRTLIAHGYSATFCTPHCWPTLYPANTPKHIGIWVQALRQALEREGLDYTLYAGGELRLYPDVIPWMQSHGVPTLGGTRFVLCDFWEKKWPKWADHAFDWLLDRGYTPILAHPERSATLKHYEQHLDRWTQRGVILQGNFQCFTGEAGFRADELVRKYMDAGRYTLLALDMHRPDSLPGRLDGIEVASQEYGSERIEAMTNDAVRAMFWPEQPEA